MGDTKQSVPVSSADPPAVAGEIQRYAKLVTGVAQDFVRASDGTISQLTPVASGGTDISGLGSGVDGALVFDGAATILGMAPVASVYTLTRDVWATNLTVDVGVVILTRGFRLFATGTATINGTLRCNGGNGAAGTAGVGGAGGAQAIVTSVGGSATGAVYGGTQAGVAGSNTGAGNSPGSLPAPGNALIGTAASSAGGTAVPLTSGANGGLFQGGGGGGGDNGNGGSTPNPTILYKYAPGFHTLEQAVAGRQLTLEASSGVATSQLGTGYAGGSGGAGLNGGGGGSGAAGGIVFLAGRTITGGGGIEAKGGTGGAGGPGASGGGGGGGGPGGVIILVYASLSGITQSVAGGAGGAGGPGGAGAGGSGGTGQLIAYKLAA